MKNLIFLALIFIIGLLQATLLNCFRFFSVKPDILLVSAVIASIFLKQKWALVISLCAGLFKDIFATTAFGVDMLFFSLLSLVIFELSKKISIEDRYALMVAVFIAVLIKGIINRFVFFYADNFVPLGIFLRVSFIEALYSALSAPLLMLIFSRFKLLAVDKEEHNYVD